MAEASIPVDLFNPGQVFACVGFLEAADVLLGDAEGGFDWNNEADMRFQLRAVGDENPFGVVLGFLGSSSVRCYAPSGWKPPPKKNNSKKKNKEDAHAQSDGEACDDSVDSSDTFPARTPDPMALPIRIVGSVGGKTRYIEVNHWADASSRNDFKLYAGNRSAAGIAHAMLAGTRDRPKKGQSEGDVKTRGVSALWQESKEDLIARPFDVLTAVGGSFNFDPRGAWTGIDAGYSPDAQKHGLAASPVIQILAAIGLNHARPDEYETRHVRYAAWGQLLPPILARPALAGEPLPVPMRRFRFTLDLSGKNKVVTFAQEEMSL
jgi:CRISPR-associated protein Csx14